jgi:alpha-glucosidase
LYVWAHPQPDGSPPNNWLSAFGGSAWTRDKRTGQCYLHLFLPEQPDLNWWSTEVRAEFEEILRFWLDRGVAGFRIDVANALVNDRQLRDDPPAAADDPWAVKRGLAPVYSLNRPEVHDVYRRWRAIAGAYAPPRVLVGEAWVRDLARWAAFSADDELHLAFAFRLLDGLFEADVMRTIVEETYAALPPEALPALAWSNHDVVRMTTRWCGGDERKVRCALLLLLTLRGVPVLYYGDEIGMPEVDVPPQEARDPVGRDGARTPMQWGAEPGCGFTTAAATPWLPFGNADACNVAAQRDEQGSVLTFCRRLIALRRAVPELRTGRYLTLPAPAGTWAWRRGAAVTVAVNLSDAPVHLDGVRGRVQICTNHSRDGETVATSLELGGWEGAVVGAP